MQQDVVGLEAGIGFQFTAPVAILVLLREKIFARRIHGYRDPAAQVINLSKSHLRRRRRTKRGGFFHHDSMAMAGAAAIVSTISGGNPKRTFSGMISNSCTSPKPFPARYSTTSCTRCSGAEAPAVKAAVFTPFNHCG